MAESLRQAQRFQSALDEQPHQMYTESFTATDEAKTDQHDSAREQNARKYDRVSPEPGNEVADHPHQVMASRRLGGPGSLSEQLLTSLLIVGLQIARVLGVAFFLASERSRQPWRGAAAGSAAH